MAVVGSGSSAIQLVPQIQKTAKKLANYVRNPTWVATNYLQDYSEDGNVLCTEEKRKEFRENPQALFDLRKKLENGYEIDRVLQHGFLERKGANVLSHPDSILTS